jgi:transposase
MLKWSIKPHATPRLVLISRSVAEAHRWQTPSARRALESERSGELFWYVDLEDRVPAKHPLRLIRRIVNEVLVALDSEFTRIYADSGRPSIAPERLLRALLLQAFYTIRSETQGL